MSEEDPKKRIKAYVDMMRFAIDDVRANKQDVDLLMNNQYMATFLRLVDEYFDGLPRYKDEEIGLALNAYDEAWNFFILNVAWSNNLDVLERYLNFVVEMLGLVEEDEPSDDEKALINGTLFNNDEDEQETQYE